MNEWIKQAACQDADTELFFSLEPEEQLEAIKICEGCPVAAECLADARAHREEYGIRAGKLRGGRAPFNSPICKQRGCASPRRTRGWCAKHYARWKRTGHPEGRPRKPLAPRHHEIVPDVAAKHGVEVSELLGRSMKIHLLTARREAMVRLREAGLSFHQIGELLDRDHSTVVAVVARADERGEAA